jgi:predicted metal-binding membrane protein
MNHRNSTNNENSGRTAIFIAGYIVVWSGFALGATLIQWGLHEATLLSPMMATSNAILGGAILVGAGAYQLSPLKLTCLNKCRTPLGFLMNEWREGPKGILSMGLIHGAYCIGCCWMLMALLFVLGVMNLLWIAALSAFVLLEKVIPGGRWLSRASGILLIAWGISLPFMT